MIYTVQGVFDKAIHLIDAQNESTGGTKTADTKEYEFRTPSIVNVLLNAVYPYSDTYAPEEGKRVVLEDVKSLADKLDLDGFICGYVLPPWLAYHLILEENPDVAMALKEDFNNAFAQMRAGAGTIGRIVPIEDCYGGIEHGEFGAWN